MIRINLLPVRQTQRRQTVQQQLLVAAASVVVTLIIGIVWYARASSEAEDLREETRQKQQELTQLDKIIGEVNELQAREKELEEKQKIIDDLRKGKTGPVRALDDLSSEIPDRVWITRLEETAGRATIEGLAIDHEDVSAFMKSLQKSKYFSGVVLEYSKAGQARGGTVLYEFRIVCSVNYAA